jgi:polar amino acid transport system substrate-binding protein
MILGAAGVAAAHDDASALARIVDKGELRVGTSGGQPPFSVTSKSGDLIGYEVDLARLLASAMGVELKLVKRPFGQLLPALEAGEVDMVMSGMTMTLERNLKAAFVGPYMVSGKSILTTSSVLAAIDEAQDINQSDLTLTALKGSTSQKFVEKLIPKAKLVTTDDYDEAIKMVMAGDADALVADYPICALTMMRYPDAGFATLSKPLTIEPIGIALPPGDSQLLNVVENYFFALEATGILEMLEKKWFEDGSWLIQVP